MAKTAKLTEKEKALLAQERQKDRQLLRQRLVGAVVVFFATFLLWKIGGVLPPQQQQTLYPVPPIDSVFPREEALAEIIDDAGVVDKEEVEVFDISEETVKEDAPAAAEAEAAVVPVENAEPVAEAAIEEDATTTNAAEVSVTAGYVVQVGAFSQLPRAEQLAGDIRQLGFAVRLQPLERDGRQLWRVQVTDFASRSDAEEAQKKLEEAGYADTEIKKS